MSEMPIEGRIVKVSQNECLIKKGNYWKIEVMDVRWFKEDKATNKGIRLNIDEAKLLVAVLRRELE